MHEAMQIAGISLVVLFIDVIIIVGIPWLAARAGHRG